MEGGPGKVFGGRLGLWAGKARIGGERRTGLTEVTEGMEVGPGKGFWWMAWIVGGKGAYRREHRTEVTEEGWRLDGGRLFAGCLRSAGHRSKMRRMMFS
jgi:hypothetical protein